MPESLDRFVITANGALDRRRDRRADLVVFAETSAVA
jgi:hypothetical protein